VPQRAELRACRRQFGFEGHDPAGRVQVETLVDQLPGAGCQLQLVMAVAAVSTTGAVRVQQPGRAELAQKRLRDTQRLAPRWSLLTGGVCC
jgi:hypothetical protein